MARKTDVFAVEELSHRHESEEGTQKVEDEIEVGVQTSHLPSPDTNTDPDPDPRSHATRHTIRAQKKASFQGELVLGSAIRHAPFVIRHLSHSVTTELGLSHTHTNILCSTQSLDQAGRRIRPWRVQELLPLQRMGGRLDG